MLCIAVFSCSSESTETPNEEEQNNTDNTLLKRMVETYDGETSTTTFTYDGNKLITYEESDGWKNVYTYENNKLVREDQYVDYELNAYLILEYNANGQLSSFKEYFLEPSGLGESVNNYILTHNNDNTISIDMYYGDENSQDEFYGTYTYYLNEKNISKIESSVSSWSLTFNYDDKNGMFKNVHDIEVINITSQTEFGAYYIRGNTNNSLSRIDTDEYGAATEAYEYTYNTNGYPKTATFTDSYEGNMGTNEYVSTIEFFYE